MADNWREYVLNSLPRNEAALPTPTATGFQPGPAVSEPLNFGGVPGGPQFDPIELLPERCADRLRLLRQRRLDARALSIPFSDIQEASMARVKAENALKRLQSHPSEGGFNLPDENRSVIEARRTLDKLTADFERLKQLQEVRSAASQTKSAALANVESWMRDGRPHGTVLEEFETEVPKQAKGENGLLDQIENRRRRVRELKADLHRISSSPFPSSYCKAQIRQQVLALAEAGTPVVSSVIEHDGAIIWPTRQVQSQVYNAQPGTLAFSEVPDAVALFAWLNRDALLARLDAEINNEADDTAALSHSDRELRTAEVMGDLLSVERDEAALCWRAQSEGLPVEHRSDCDPCAILQIRLVTAPRASHGPTSPDHAIDFSQPGRRR